MKKLQYLSRKLRYKICEMSFRAKAAHLASSLSCIDMLISIYFGKVFKFNNSRTFSRDKFILSKGHAAAALYSVLAEKKIIQNLNYYYMEKIIVFMRSIRILI